MDIYHINGDPAVEWKPHQLGMIYPETDAYYSGIIGSGFNSEEFTPNYIANKGQIFGNIWGKNEHGIWDRTGYYADPFAFSGKTSVWVMYAYGNNNARCVGYHNVQFNGGHAVIDYASGFNLPQTEGRFTLTGIPAKHNGKYAILLGAFGNPPTALYGLKDAISVTAFKGFPITGGTAEIPVFKYESGDTQFSSYDTSNKVSSLVIIIQDEEAFDFLEYSDALSKWDGNPQNYPLSGLVYADVPFTGGKASIAYDPAKAVGGLE